MNMLRFGHTRIRDISLTLSFSLTFKIIKESYPQIDEVALERRGTAVVVVGKTET